MERSQKAAALATRSVGRADIVRGITPEHEFGLALFDPLAQDQVAGGKSFVILRQDDCDLGRDRQRPRQGLFRRVGIPFERE